MVPLRPDKGNTSMRTLLILLAWVSLTAQAPAQDDLPRTHEGLYCFEEWSSYESWVVICRDDRRFTEHWHQMRSDQGRVRGEVFRTEATTWCVDFTWVDPRSEGPPTRERECFLSAGQTQRAFNWLRTINRIESYAFRRIELYRTPFHMRID